MFCVWPFFFFKGNRCGNSEAVSSQLLTISRSNIVLFNFHPYQGPTPPPLNFCTLIENKSWRNPNVFSFLYSNLGLVPRSWLMGVLPPLAWPSPSIARTTDSIILVFQHLEPPIPLERFFFECKFAGIDFNVISKPSFFSGTVVCFLLSHRWGNLLRQQTAN